MNSDTLSGIIFGFLAGAFLMGILLVCISTPNTVLISRGFAHYNATNGNFELNK